MKNLCKLSCTLLFWSVLGFSQSSTPASVAGETQPTATVNSGEQSAGSSYSGMYTFLQDGEFVQLTIEESAENSQKQKSVSGFVSRYGNTDSDRGAFLDQFIKHGTLDGNTITFATETVHGTWYEFKGTIDRGPGKNVGDEGYYLIKGALAEFTSDSSKKSSTSSRQVAFKSFPQDAGAPPKRQD